MFDLLLFFGCDEEVSKAYDKSLLLGNWKRINTNLNNGCIEYLEFNEATYQLRETCTGISIGYGLVSYTLDGDEIIVSENVEYTIKYLSQDLLKLENTNKIIEEYIKP